MAVIQDNADEQRARLEEWLERLAWAQQRACAKATLEAVTRDEAGKPQPHKPLDIAS